MTNAAAYSQDIGPNCVNLTTPNRTLEEFVYSLVVRTTDPEIKGTTLADLERRRRCPRHPSVSWRRRNRLARRSPGRLVADEAVAVAGALPSMRPPIRRRPGRIGYKTVAGRAALTADNSVDWDGTPTFYQATTIAHGHILFYKQVWKADGYSLGICCTACRWRRARRSRS